MGDCTTPEYHKTHYYCPSCDWVAPDAPKSELSIAKARIAALEAENRDFRAYFDKIAPGFMVAYDSERAALSRDKGAK